MDRLFGGHLLSSIVCDECKHCMQRVEPFLDLSLPIIDDQYKATAFESEANERESSARSKRDKKRDLPLSLNAATASNKPGCLNANDFIDNKDKQVSKNQSKKQRKLSLKKNKVILMFLSHRI